MAQGLDSATFPCSGALAEIRQPHTVIYSEEEELSRACSLADEAEEILQDKLLSKSVSNGLAWEKKKTLNFVQLKAPGWAGPQAKAQPIQSQTHRDAPGCAELIYSCFA